MNTTTMNNAKYVAFRSKDAAQLMSEMQWAPGPITGTLQCSIYGHSILWDPRHVLHAGDWCDFEVKPLLGADIECFEDLTGLIAWLLRKNW